MGEAQGAELRAEGAEQRAKNSELRAKGSGLRAESKERRSQRSGDSAPAEAESTGRRVRKRRTKSIRISLNMEDFRFEKLDIWKEALEISDILFDYADIADSRKLYKFAEQLRAATMSISNNIAEGSGSFSDKEFASFLNIARRSVFECANIIYVFVRRGIITNDEKSKVYDKLVTLSKMITAFRKSLI